MCAAGFGGAQDKHDTVNVKRLQWRPLHARAIYEKIPRAS